jgi:predicted lipoprotein
MVFKKSEIWYTIAIRNLGPTHESDEGHKLFFWPSQ